MRQLFILVVLCLSLTGCSLLPKLSFVSNNSVPQQSDKSKDITKCGGSYTLNADGTYVCTKDYYSYNQNASIRERKMTIFEKVGAFFGKLNFIFALLIILSAVLSLMGLGGLVTTIWHNAFSTSAKGIRMIVAGIQNAKTYIKSNGVQYTDAERKIYVQGWEDGLAKINEMVTDKKVKEQIAILRTQV